MQNEADHGELPRGLRSGLVPFAQLTPASVRLSASERVADLGLLTWG